MTAPRTLIITKPDRQQARWHDGLSAAGYEAIALPLLTTETLDETPEQRQIWLNLDQFHGVIVVSPAAAEILATRLDTYWPQPPVGIQWLCNGSGTAEVLRAAVGTEVQFPRFGNRAEDVLALPVTQAVQDQRWLIVAGEGGREVTQPELTERGARVTRVEVYRRLPVALPESEQQQLNRSDVMIQISSLAALECLTSHATMVTKHNTPLLISSPRLESAARSLGWQRLVMAQGASLEAALDALNSLQEPTL